MLKIIMDRSSKKMPEAQTTALSLPPLSASKTDPTSRVGFSDKVVKVEHDRKKYLTAKYGQHQMALIKKRLSVELWLIEELQMLYPKEGPGSSSPGYGSDVVDECDIDLDDLLDIERDDERRRFLRQKLSACPQPSIVVARFIEDLLVKAKSL